MRIRNRLFSYPVLNSNVDITDYADGTTFELSFDKNENGVFADGNIVLKNARIETNSGYMLSLISAGIVKGLLVIECSNSVFRRKYELSNAPRDIVIPANNFSGRVEMSAFVYAANDFILEDAAAFKDIYNSSDFNIEKYCILAADDELSIEVDNQPENDNKSSSIFTIIRKETDDNIMRSEMDGRKIRIYLPQEQFDNYNSIKNSEELRNASFATIAIPVLTESIMSVREELKK